MTITKTLEKINENGRVEVSYTHVDYVQAVALQIVTEIISIFLVTVAEVVFFSVMCQDTEMHIVHR